MSESQNREERVSQIHNGHLLWGETDDNVLLLLLLLLLIFRENLNKIILRYKNCNYDSKSEKKYWNF